MKLKICILVVIVIAGSNSVFANHTYVLNPVDTSMPTVNDTGDYINGGLQAWFGFNLTGVTASSPVVSATLSAYFWNMSDDSWISVANGSLSDPGNSVVADEIVSTFIHDEPSGSGYVWKTITITYDNWASDIADGYISLMVTGGQYGSVGMNINNSWGITRLPELTLVTLPAPGAIFLGSTGIGVISWLRRRRQLV
jgi:hypothetical protein